MDKSTELATMLHDLYDADNEDFNDGVLSGVAMMVNWLRNATKQDIKDVILELDGIKLCIANRTLFPGNIN